MTRHGEPLYAYPSIYRKVFPVEEESLAFYARAVGGHAQMLDVGGGTGEFAERLSERAGARVMNVDIDARMLRAGRGGIAGSAVALPFADQSFGAVVSRLLSVGYAIGAEPELGAEVAREIGRVLKPDGIVALEVPLAHAPRKLQGVEERADLGEGLEYSFRWLELLQQTEWGALLESLIEVRRGSDCWSIAAPLHVFTPEGALRWLSVGELKLRGFCAPYDWGTLTTDPPRDCLRGIVLSRRD
jgi:SAM-dependent methyltransferase